MVGILAGLDQAPALLLLPIVDDVEAGAFFRITQHGIRFGNLAELRRVARFLVVGMKALREQAIDAVDGIRLCAGAHLQHVVVVDWYLVIHAGARARHGPLSDTQFRAERAGLSDETAGALTNSSGGCRP